MEDAVTAGGLRIGAEVKRVVPAHSDVASVGQLRAFRTGELRPSARHTQWGLMAVKAGMLWMVPNA
jgi:hypothetical protein